MNERRISQALESTRQLEDRIYLLTGEELAKAIEIESATLRRETVLKRLLRDQRRRERSKNLQP